MQGDRLGAGDGQRAGQDWLAELYDCAREALGGRRRSGWRGGKLISRHEPVAAAMR